MNPCRGEVIGLCCARERNDVLKDPAHGRRADDLAPERR
jgi:hypothetical protein